MSKSQIKRLHYQSKISHNQPEWVCNDCGHKHGRGPIFVVSTYHTDVCGVCNKTLPVTEPRDFGYLLEGWDCE